MENLAFTNTYHSAAEHTHFVCLLGSALVFLTNSRVSKEAIYACALQRFKNHFKMC